MDDIILSVNWDCGKHPTKPLTTRELARKNAFFCAAIETKAGWRRVSEAVQMARATPAFLARFKQLRREG